MRQRLLVLTAASFAFLGNSADASRFKYRVDDNGDRSIRYAGGLLGGGFDARLEGSFDVERDASGAATILRFDVTITDPIFDDASSSTSNPTGKALAGYLIHNPVGLPINVFPTPGVGRVELDASAHPRTILSISDWESPTAQLRIYSGFNRLIDAPALMTLAGGITVVPVPEPKGLAVVLGAIAALPFAQRLRTS
jgi:hypothetical protein